MAKRKSRKRRRLGEFPVSEQQMHEMHFYTYEKAPDGAVCPMICKIYHSALRLTWDDTLIVRVVYFGEHSELRKFFPYQRARLGARNVLL